MNKKEAMNITYKAFPETCGDIEEIILEALGDSIDEFANTLKNNVYVKIMNRIPNEITIPFREAMADIIEELHDKIESLEEEIYELKKDSK